VNKTWFECRCISNKGKIYKYHMLISTATSIHDEKFSSVIAIMKLKASQSENSVLAKCETLYSSIQDVLTAQSALCILISC